MHKEYSLDRRLGSSVRGRHVKNTNTKDQEELDAPYAEPVRDAALTVEAKSSVRDLSSLTKYTKETNT